MFVGFRGSRTDLHRCSLSFADLLADLHRCLLGFVDFAPTSMVGSLHSLAIQSSVDVLAQTALQLHFSLPGGLLMFFI